MSAQSIKLPLRKLKIETTPRKRLVSNSSRLKVPDEVNGPKFGEGEETPAESEDTSSSSDEEQAERKGGKGKWHRGAGRKL